MTKRTRRRLAKIRITMYALMLLLYPLALMASGAKSAHAANGPVYLISINGPINPATDDFLRTSIDKAQAANARVLVIQLNTPGGLLTSMQTMVESLLEAPIPTVVYVSPKGGGAISAGVFITMAGHVAVMAPGTTIGAAHPVSGGGQDIQGDMREKLENFAASHIKAIAEERGRNVKWAEQAVRESVAITAQEALDEGVIDFLAGDLDKLLEELEGRTVKVKGEPVSLTGLKDAPLQTVEMSFKQYVVNILADPNIAILLGLGAMLGIGLELYHPGGILPGVFGAICLVLSLIAAQVLPINVGGVVLLLLGFALFAVELFLPSFGIWGGAGIICLVLGSIYVVDTDMVWGIEGFEVDRWFIGSIAGTVGVVLLVVSLLAVRAQGRKVSTGREGLVGQTGKVLLDFKADPKENAAFGKVQVMGEIWNGRAELGAAKELSAGDKMVVVSIESGMTLVVRPD